MGEPERMTMDASWRLPDATLALGDARLAIAEVAARCPGVVFRRDVADAADEASNDDERAWVDGTESFMIGFPELFVRDHGDDPPHGPDEQGLFWGEVLFLRGVEAGPGAAGVPASMEISSSLTGGEALWASLADFAGEVAAELGGAPEDEERTSVDGREPGAALTWTQIRAWLRKQDVEITDETREYVSFVVTWDEDDRAQLVTIDRVNRFRMPWLRLTSGVCKLPLMTADEAIARNDTLVASLACDDVDYYLVHHVPLAGLTFTLLDTLIWDVGSEADLLEQEVNGGSDEY